MTQEINTLICTPFNNYQINWTVDYGVRSSFGRVTNCGVKREKLEIELFDARSRITLTNLHRGNLYHVLFSRVQFVRLNGFELIDERHDAASRSICSCGSGRCVAHGYRSLNFVGETRST